MNVLPDSLEMGPVTLRVADIDLALRFYRQGVGLAVMESSANGYVLGSSVGQALILEHSKHLKHAGSNEAGLFHTAFLFGSRTELAQAVAQVAAMFPGSFTGSADHLVSEAFYFDDPEGNGVELYFDRPRDQWQRVGREIKMDSLPLDPNAYLANHLGQTDSLAPKIGHVHLSVGDLPQAQDFYVQTLGFEITTNFGTSAMFVSAGGYHHHMAMNIWRSRGAGRRQQTLGLGDVSLLLGSDQELDRVLSGLKETKKEFAFDGKTLSLQDPWGNQVSIRA